MNPTNYSEKKNNEMSFSPIQFLTVYTPIISVKFWITVSPWDDSWAACPGRDALSGRKSPGSPPDATPRYAPRSWGILTRQLLTTDHNP